MSNTISVSTSVPGLTARLRLPRHHVAARDQAIVDLATTVQALVERIDKGVQIPQPLLPGATKKGVRTDDTPDEGVHSMDTLAGESATVDALRTPLSGYERGGTRSASTPDALSTAEVTCGCSWADAPNHDIMLRRVSCATPRDVADLIELADMWGDMEESLDRANVPLLDLETFAAEHNHPDPALTSRLVRAVRHLDKMRRENDRQFDAKAEGARLMAEITEELGGLREAVENAERVPTEIRARRIVLVTDDGRETITIDADTHGGPAITVTSESGDEVSLTADYHGAGINFYVQQHHAMSIVTTNPGNGGDKAEGVYVLAGEVDEVSHPDMSWLRGEELRTGLAESLKDES